MCVYVYVYIQTSSSSSLSSSSSVELLALFHLSIYLSIYLSLYSQHALFPPGPPDYILYSYKAIFSKFLLVSQHWQVHVKRCTYFLGKCRRNFLENANGYILLVSNYQKCLILYIFQVVLYKKENILHLLFLVINGFLPWKSVNYGILRGIEYRTQARMVNIFSLMLGEKKKKKFKSPDDVSLWLS